MFDKPPGSGIVVVHPGTIVALAIHSTFQKFPECKSCTSIQNVIKSWTIFCAVFTMQLKASKIKLNWIPVRANKQMQITACIREEKQQGAKHNTSTPTINLYAGHY